MAALQVKIGDRIRKSDSGLEYVVERFEPKDLSRAVNGRCRVHFEGSKVSYAGRLLTNGSASLNGFEAVRARKSKPKQLPLEVPPAAAEQVASPALAEPSRSWTKGDVVVDPAGDRCEVLSVGLAPGEMLESRFVAELLILPGDRRVRIDGPCRNGVMGLRGWTIEQKAAS